MKNLKLGYSCVRGSEKMNKCGFVDITSRTSNRIDEVKNKIIIILLNVYFVFINKN